MPLGPVEQAGHVAPSGDVFRPTSENLLTLALDFEYSLDQ